jgi:phage terminase Nu1 subunit (DNA packaging protein)
MTSLERTSGGLRAYAEHRKALGLPGTTHVAVRNAIQDGRLSESVKNVDGATVIDFVAADVEWAARTDPTRQQRTVRNAEAEEATRRRLFFRAKTLERKCRDRQAQLVDAHGWAAAVGAMLREIRESIGSIPGEWAHRCGHLSAEVLVSARQAVDDALGLLETLEEKWPAPSGPLNMATPPARESDEAAPLSLTDVAALEKFWHARAAELEFYELTGAALRVAAVQSAVEEVCSNVRSRLLGMPSGMKQRAPELTLTELATLDGLIRETLTTLAEHVEAA